MTRNEQFRLYMKAANETSGKHGDHLNEAQMLAYCRGLIPTAEREAAESHIVECEQCITLFRSARDFLEPGFENEVIDKAEMNLTWQSTGSRVRDEVDCQVRFISALSITSFSNPGSRKSRALRKSVMHCSHSTM